MSRSLQWNVVAYMIGAALLASLFFSFNLSASVWNKRSTDIDFPKHHGPLPVIAAIPQFKPVPVSTALPKSLLQPAAVPSISHPTVTPAPVPSVPEKIVSPPTVIPLHTYKVTSYYLNVRALPSADSDILRAVKQDSLLQAQRMTDSEWLALEGGGYVNGRYTSLLEPAAEPEAALPTAAKAAIPTAVTAAAPQAKAVQLQAKPKAQAQILNAKPSNATEQIYKPVEAAPAGNPIKPSSKVMSDSGLTKEHIATLLKGTKLAGQGLEEVILGVEQKYGINAFFTIAVMKLESGNGKSTLSRTKNNLFGLNAVTGNAHQKAFSFATKGDSVKKFAQLINDNYVERGFTTIEKVARKYCPANGLWARHVQTIMRGDYGKLD